MLVDASELRVRIQALGRELQNTQTLDGETRSALSALQRVIAEVLETGDADSLTDRLEKVAVRFENDHPAVGRALRQAIDALAKAGM